MHIVTLSGSIRTASLNRALLIELGRIIPAPHHVQMLEIADLPHYSEDHDASPPAVVTAFRTAMQNADALVIATPEYITATRVPSKMPSTGRHDPMAAVP